MGNNLPDRLTMANIVLAADTGDLKLYTRDNCIAIVDRRGSIGSTGVMTEHGLAYLVWHDGQGFLKSKTTELPASEEQIAEVQKFSQDLAAALG